MTDRQTNPPAASLFERGMGACITRLDIIKTLAVLIMICDHVGAYFFDDINLYRVIGRIGLPVWFFLAGYGKGRQIPPILWGGGIFLILVDLVTCQAILPVNALVSIMVIRLSVDFIGRHFLRKADTMIALYLILLLGILLPVDLFEYGAVGVFLGITGYLVRQSSDAFPDRLLGPYWPSHLFCLVIALAVQIINFEFNLTESLVMSAGLSMMFAWLVMMHKTPWQIPVRSGALATILRLGGRYTLEIYVIHITLFCVLAFFLYPDARACFQMMPVK